MIKIPFSLGWERAIGQSKEFWLGNDNPRVKVDLPDDFIINQPRTAEAVGGASTGYFTGGRAVYTKCFEAPAEWSDKTVVLDIDGAYMNAEVTMNGEALGVHPYGYTPWQLDLKDAIIPGEKNELEVVTRCIQPNSRWYSGGGLYREVSLWIGEACHIRPWDIAVTTAKVRDSHAVIHIEAVVTNESEKDAQGTLQIRVGETKASLPVKVAAGSTRKMESDIEVVGPVLWSAESPHLYHLELELQTNLGTDHSELPVGIRKIEIDAKNGMRVNGQPVKLLGGCIHHDNTLLGAAAFPRAEERKIELLKTAGYNAVRCSHNPPSEALLNACDRLGMYVIDETFDCWRVGKNDQDYHLYFDEWWQRDTEAMVRRDRNHPSVFCWSVGNELVEAGGMSKGVELAGMQADFVRSLDPDRPVMAAFHSMIKTKREKDKPPRMPFAAASQKNDSEKGGSEEVMKRMADPAVFEKMIENIATNNMGDGFVNGEDVWGEISEDCAAMLDIVGYNYLPKRYTADAKKYPDRIICASETHANNTYDYYQAMMENSNVIGDFIWTAYDNLGEAGAGRVLRSVQDMASGMLGAWPWLSCYQGDFDLDGNRRPQSYYRKVMWQKDDGIHLFDKPPQYTGRKSQGLGWQWSDVWKSWTWPEAYIGKDIDVECYADCDTVEFILNDEVVGTAPVTRFKAEFTLPYQPGTLKVIAHKEGRITAEDTLITAGEPKGIRLIPDRKEIRADGMDLCFVKVCLVDGEGEIVPTDDLEVTADVEGGNLAGFGSGNPCTDENYGTGKRKLWKGQGLICLRAPMEPGKITLKVTGKGFEEELEIRCS